MQIGVPNPLQQSQYSTPVFIIPNKEDTVRFITYYLRINQQLVGKQHSFPRTVKTIQKMENIQYVAALYLNVGYYKIRLFPTSQYMTTIVTEFVKLRFNHLPMGMFASVDIF